MNAWICVIASCLSGVVPAAEPEVDFNREVRPILARHCLLCHGPDESSRQADLRLDTFAAATDWSIIPGDADGSEVMLRVDSDDPDVRMPPSEHGPPLSTGEREILRRWIDGGAQYDVHWSYQKPVRPTVPKDSTGWSRNDIDRLVIPKIAGRGWSPAATADRYTLARRVALDLTGLPPTPEEVERFVGDGSEQAYESLVDYFLAKDSFGERWAAMWLDQARYADTMGYAEDRARNIWAYRDYVIRSFLNNKPFDQFTVEQIAGDLLPDPTDEQLVATAFHRNTLTNTEGGTVDEEFRSAAVVDRTNTTMAVWMGTTFGCAQCHTHKYDPISQKEYFQVYAFFNNTRDNDQPNDSPTLPVYSNQQKQQRAEIQKQIDEVQRQRMVWLDQTVAERETQLAAQQRQWEQQVLAADDLDVQGRFLRLELTRPNAILSLAEVQIFVGQQNVALQGQATQSSTAYNGPAKLAIDGNTDGQFEKSKSVTHTATETNPWWELDLLKSMTMDQIKIWNRTDGGLYQRMADLKISILDDQRNEVWSLDFPVPKKTVRSIVPGVVPRHIQMAMQADPRSAEQAEQVQTYYRERFGPLAVFDARQADLQRKKNDVRPMTTVPILQELPSDQRRTTNVHHRGSYLDKGELVGSAIPGVFHPLSAESPDRLALARWLVDRENPLTARVTVNRLWQQLFGIGIVATSEEFGTQGELPSNPALLDYLACELMDHNWDLKAILKQMVMSATYRQSSVATPDKQAQDPNNRLLARGPRFRLTAEMVRDQALFCSGLLSDKMFGAPVQPPQPKRGLKVAFRSESTDWENSVGEDRYRRAIYTRWQRSNPYPSLSTFDVSNREVCELRRLRTNTPLQALVTLNDPVFVEAAQALARRIVKAGNTDAQRAESAIRFVLVRPATQDELRTLLQLVAETREHFATRADEAKLLANDIYHPQPKGTNWAELAVWTTVANVVLNLDETLMKR